jgi:hypothetical protein
VRPLLRVTAEGIDHAVRALAPLVRAEDRHLLEPRLRHAHEGLVGELRDLHWAHPEVAVEHALEVLLRETVPNGAIDPGDDEADVPWCLVLVRLVEVPHLGAHAARRWFGHLYRMQFEDGLHVSALVEATAAYAVAAFEMLLGRHHEAARWMRTAEVVCEHDERPMIGLITYLRAARLLEPLLRRCHASCPSP